VSTSHHAFVIAPGTDMLSGDAPDDEAQKPPPLQRHGKTTVTYIMPAKPRNTSRGGPRGQRVAGTKKEAWFVPRLTNGAFGQATSQSDHSSRMRVATRGILPEHQRCSTVLSYVPRRKQPTIHQTTAAHIGRMG
jgi:hypothetical protein